MTHENRRKRFSGCKLMVLGAIMLIFPCLGFGPLKFNDQQLTLRGVEEIQVVVKVGLSREGPTRQGLQEEVEKELVKGGVRIVKNANQEEQESLPVLYVEVAVWKNADNPYVYFVTGNFYQRVYLSRNPDIRTQAATWSASVIGEGMIERIQDDVARMAKTFSDQYRFVNQNNPDG